MTIVRELLTAIGFDVDDAGAKEADKTFKGLFESASKLSFQFNQVFDAVSKGISVIRGAADTALEVPSKLLAMAEATAAAGDRFAKTGQQIGLTAEELQRLEFAAERSGLEAQSLRDVFKDLSKNMAAAGAGSKMQADLFRKLGVSVKGADGAMKPASLVLGEIANGLGKVQSPAQRAAISMALMGEAGLKAAPLLAGGSAGIKALTDRADELGFVLSNRAAAASETFIDQVTDMRRASSGISNAIGVALLPRLGELVSRITLLILRMKPLIVSGFGLLAQAVLKVSGVILSAVEIVHRYATVIAIFGVVLGTVASVITVTLLPAIWAYIASLNILTIAQIKAVAIPALIAAGFLALAAVIALVIEDVYQFVSGGESAIGNLHDFFLNNPADGDEHWVVTALRFIIVTVHDAIMAVDQFFAGFFEDLEETGSLTGVLGKLWDTAVDGWVDTIKWFFGWLFGQFSAFNDFADRISKRIDDTVNGAFRSVIDRAKGLASQLSGLPLVGGLFESDGPAAFAGAGSPASAPLPAVVRSAAAQASAGAPNVNNTISRGATQITVNAPAGSPGDIASAAAQALEERLDRDRRETQRILEANARVLR